MPGVQTADRGARVRITLLCWLVLLSLALMVLGSAAQQATTPCTEGHDGALVIDGNDTLTISGEVFCQHGNITVRGNAQLIIHDATLRLENPSPDIWGGRVYLFVEDQARVTLRNAVIECPDGGAGLQAWGTAIVLLDNVRTDAERGLYVTCGGNATLTVRSCDIAVSDARDHGTLVLSDSSVSEIGLYFTRDVGPVQLESLAGRYYDSWSTPAGWNTGYHISLTRTQVGAWAVDLSYGADVTLRNSVVEGVGLWLQGAVGELSQLQPGLYGSWDLQRDNAGTFSVDLSLLDSRVDAWFVNLQSPAASLALTACTLMELDVWDTSADITLTRATIGGIRLVNSTGRISSGGEVRFGNIKLEDAVFALAGRLDWLPTATVASWENSALTREYQLEARTPTDEAADDAQLLLEAPSGKLVTLRTTPDGEGLCTIVFDDTNYMEIWTLHAGVDPLSAVVPVSLLTSSPVVIVVPN